MAVPLGCVLIVNDVYLIELYKTQILYKWVSRCDYILTIVIVQCNGGKGKRWGCEYLQIIKGVSLFVPLLLW